jgi:hypothetical protein
VGDQRHKVGDVDEAGRQALRDAIAGKPTPPVKAAPAAPSAPPRTREPVHGGVGLDEIVTGAERGPDPKNQHTDHWN